MSQDNQIIGNGSNGIEGGHGPVLDLRADPIWNELNLNVYHQIITVSDMRRLLAILVMAFASSTFAANLLTDREAKTNVVWYAEMPTNIFQLFHTIIESLRPAEAVR